MIDADPVAAGVQEIMAERSAWTGCAAELLRAGADMAGNGVSGGNRGWPKNPRALAGCLRRVQTALRTLGIEITFSREGRAGMRIIRMIKAAENTVSTASSVCNNGDRTDTYRPGQRPGPKSADDADVADAKVRGRRFVNQSDGPCARIEGKPAHDSACKAFGVEFID